MGNQTPEKLILPWMQLLECQGNGEPRSFVHFWKLAFGSRPWRILHCERVAPDQLSIQVLFKRPP